MRALCLVTLLCLPLAGCMQEGPDPDPLLGVCPQWTQGPWSQVLSVALDGSADQNDVVVPQQEGQDLLESQGRPLDMYRLTIRNASVDGGPLELRAYAGEAGPLIGIHDYRAAAGPRPVPVLVLGGEAALEGAHFQVFLSPVEHGSQPAPSPLRLEWRLAEGNARLEVEVTAHYRVCGAIIP